MYFLGPPILNANAFYWRNLSPATKGQFDVAMKNALDSIHVSFKAIVHGNCICNKNEYIFSIEKYFSDIVHAVNVADKILLKSSPFFQKDYWNERSSELNRASLDVDAIRKDYGTPGHWFCSWAL
jgi:hypothetical protein